MNARRAEESSIDRKPVAKRKAIDDEEMINPNAVQSTFRLRQVRKRKFRFTMGAQRDSSDDDEDFIQRSIQHNDLATSNSDVDPFT